MGGGSHKQGDVVGCRGAQVLMKGVLAPPLPGLGCGWVGFQGGTVRPAGKKSELAWGTGCLLGCPVAAEGCRGVRV